MRHNPEETGDLIELSKMYGPAGRVNEFFFVYFICYLFHIDICYFTICYFYANLSQQLHTIKTNYKKLHRQNHRNHLWRNYRLVTEN